MSLIERLDAVVDEYVRRTRFYNEPITLGRAQMWCLQHRLNTRFRNSVLKLSVATNCPDWDIRMKIIAGCAQEIIADHEFGHGKAHWEIIEDLGVAVGLTREEIRAEKPRPSTQVAWLAWEALMKNRNWLEGLIANTCGERTNIPGYGEGEQRRVGNAGVQHQQWKRLFKLTDEQLAFWNVHTEADIEHSNLGWQTIAERAEQMGMGDQVIEACRQNYLVWELYLDGILDAGDERDRQRESRTVLARG